MASTLSSKTVSGLITATKKSVRHFLREKETLRSCGVFVLQESFCGLTDSSCSSGAWWGFLAPRRWTVATCASNEASGFGFEAKMPADDLDDLCTRCREMSLREHKHKARSEKTQTHKKWRRGTRIESNAIRVTWSRRLACAVMPRIYGLCTYSNHISQRLHSAQDSNIWVLITSDYSQSSLIRADISTAFQLNVSAALHTTLKADGLSLSVLSELNNLIVVCVTPTNCPQSVHTLLMQITQQPLTGKLQSDWLIFLWKMAFVYNVLG